MALASLVSGGKWARKTCERDWSPKAVQQPSKRAISAAGWADQSEQQQ